MNLSKQQFRVMVALSAGFTRDEICQRLGIARETFRVHTRLVRRHLGVNNTIKAINVFQQEITS